ncbi:hypothetical protein D3C72_2452600 [compost metagenome]
MRAAMRPSIEPASVSHSAKPRPMPWSRVVKNGANRRGIASAAMPGPVSLTLNW